MRRQSSYGGSQRDSCQGFATPAGSLHGVATALGTMRLSQCSPWKIEKFPEERPRFIQARQSKSLRGFHLASVAMPRLARMSTRPPLPKVAAAALWFVPSLLNEGFRR